MTTVAATNTASAATTTVDAAVITTVATASTANAATTATTVAASTVVLTVSDYFNIACNFRIHFRLIIAIIPMSFRPLFV